MDETTPHTRRPLFARERFELAARSVSNATIDTTHVAALAPLITQLRHMALAMIHGGQQLSETRTRTGAITRGQPLSTSQKTRKHALVLKLGLSSPTNCELLASRVSVSRECPRGARSLSSVAGGCRRSRVASATSHAAAIEHRAVSRRALQCANANARRVHCSSEEEED